MLSWHQKQEGRAGHKSDERQVEKTTPQPAGKSLWSNRDFV